MSQATSLLIPSKPVPTGCAGRSLFLTPEDAGWRYLGLEVCQVPHGDTWRDNTGPFEVAAVLLGGVADVRSTAGEWMEIGARSNVFAGLPYALFFPPETEFEILARSDLEIALCKSGADKAYPARLIRPEDVEVEIRGGGNATRQICNILGPEFPAQHIMVVEVYTPSGNWSSYPPHKHDTDNLPEEVKLEEYYYYRVSRPEGYAFQRIYSGDGRLDVLLPVDDQDLVLVPKGYHPVVAAPGYDLYYLNALAGELREMVPNDDPAHAWIKSTWRNRDPRVPLVL